MRRSLLCCLSLSAVLVTLIACDKHRDDEDCESPSDAAATFSRCGSGFPPFPPWKKPGPDGETPDPGTDQPGETPGTDDPTGGETGPPVVTPPAPEEPAPEPPPPAPEPEPVTTAGILNDWCAKTSGYDLHADVHRRRSAVCEGSKVNPAFLRLADSPYTGGTATADDVVHEQLNQVNGAYVEYAYYYAFLLPSDTRATIDRILPAADYAPVITEGGIVPTTTTVNRTGDIAAAGGDHIGGSHNEVTTAIGTFSSMTYEVDYHTFLSGEGDTLTGSDFIHLTTATEDNKQLVSIRVVFPTDRGTLVLGFTHVELKAVASLFEQTVDGIRARSLASQKNAFRAAQ